MFLKERCLFIFAPVWLRSFLLMDSPGRVTLAHFAEGRGVAVTCDVKAGDILLKVPLSKVWSAENALKALGVATLSEKEAIIAHLMLADEEEVALLPTLEELHSVFISCLNHFQTIF